MIAIHGADELLSISRSLKYLQNSRKRAVREYDRAHITPINTPTELAPNLWSVLRRCFNGTYVSVEPFHLFRYLDEHAFRFNEREGQDADRLHMRCFKDSGLS